VRHEEIRYIEPLLVSKSPCLPLLEKGIQTKPAIALEPQLRSASPSLFNPIAKKVVQLRNAIDLVGSHGEIIIHAAKL
jgi:hypothetical protein